MPYLGVFTHEKPAAICRPTAGDQGLFGIVHKRLLALALALTGVFPSLTYALGLGDIEVYSALNQPLVAEIDLTSVRPGEVDDMVVELADEEAFSRSGLERPFHLTRLRFEVATKDDGSEYIKVTTDDPVREPFLNFLVDVDWPRGRLMREYTILLDPPVFATTEDTGEGVSEPAPSSGQAPDSASAAGEPAMIERDETAAPGAGESGAAEDEFGYDDAGDDGDPSTFKDTYTFGDDTETDADSDGGFGVDSDAEVVTSDLPEIEFADETDGDEAAGEADDDEMAGEAGDDDTGADVFAYDQGPDATAPDDLAGPAAAGEGTPEAGEFEEFGYEEEPADTSAIEEEEQPATGEPDTAELPDIDLAFDDTLPYDEESTNALMAQFAAEDEARDRGGARPAPETDTGSGDEQASPDEHEVQDGDTLHEIASRYKAPDVTVNQAMLALLRYNPDAFIRDNINNVKKGFVLRVPDRDSMLEIDNAEALEEVRRQHALWREYRSQLAGAPSTEQDARAADDLSIAERGAESDDDSELRIVAPGADAEGSDRASGEQEGSETGSALREDLQLAREELEAERLEKQELQERIGELNEQIEKQDRLISVQSEQLAQLQQRLRELEGEDALPEVEEPAAGEERPADEEQDPAAQTAADGGDEQPESSRPGLGMTLQGEGDDGPGPGEGEEPADAESGAGESVADTGEDAGGDAADEAAGQAGADLDEELALSDDPLALDQLPEEQPGEERAAADEVDETDADNETGTTDEAATGAAATAPDAETRSAESRPQPATRSGRPDGIAGYAYDILPAPYNVMAADALKSPIGLGVLAAVGLLLLVMLVAVFKPSAPKKPKRSAFIESLAQESESEEAGAAEEAEETPAMTVTPKKPSLGERLSAMFAPLTGALGKKDKRAGEPADQAHDEAAEAGGGEVADDAGEIESFDDTAEAAAAGFTGETASGQTGQAQGGFTETSRSAEPPAAAPAESEEAFSDDTTQEADVYLAYGLYDQAEELLTQALSTSPDNVHYTGKLLETYFAAGKKGEFESLADKLHTSLGGRSSRIWDKTVAMGKEIAPDNALFRQADTGGLNVSDFAPAKPETADLDLSEPQGATTPDIAFEEESGGAASTTTDFDLDLGEADEGGGFGGDDLEQAGGASEGSESELEFDLDAGDDEDVGSELNIDFNAEELGLDADSEPAVELDADTDSGSEEPAIELDIDADADSEAPAIELDTDTDTGSGTGAADDTDLDVDDMDATVAMDLSFNLDDEKESAGQSGSGDEELDAIELDSDMDLGDVSDMDAGESVDFDADAGDDLISELDYSDDDSPQEASSDTEFEISDDDDTIIDADLDDDTLSGDSDFDEVATKLDLAKAYMDMGDTDGASSTLEEVMAEGSDDQRREAEELLDQIN